MMKKLIVLLLALLLCLPVAAETAEPTVTPEPMATPQPVAAEELEMMLEPFTLTLPAGIIAQYTPGGTSITFTDNTQATRVVAMVISRVPDVEGDHAAELERLMGQFAPGAQGLTPLTLSSDCHGLMATSPSALKGVEDAPVDQVTVMVLWQTPLRGELLILSGYDVNGNTDRAQAMVELLLQSVAVEGMRVAPAAEEK